MICYPATFIKDIDGTVDVQFLDLPTCLTYGDNLEHAKAMAKEALTGILETMIEHDDEVPLPTKRSGKSGVYFIEPDKSDIIERYFEGIKL